MNSRKAISLRNPDDDNDDDSAIPNARRVRWENALSANTEDDRNGLSLSLPLFFDREKRHNVNEQENRVSTPTIHFPLNIQPRSEVHQGLQSLNHPASDFVYFATIYLQYVKRHARNVLTRITRNVDEINSRDCDVDKFNSPRFSLNVFNRAIFRLKTQHTPENCGDISHTINVIKSWILTIFPRAVYRACKKPVSTDACLNFRTRNVLRYNSVRNVNGFLLYNYLNLPFDGSQLKSSCDSHLSPILAKSYLQRNYESVYSVSQISPRFLLSSRNSLTNS